MNVVYQVTVTDDDVWMNVADALFDAKDNGWIEIPDDIALHNFIHDCTEIICDKCEDHYYGGPPEYEDYKTEVLDLAKEYGYITED